MYIDRSTQSTLSQFSLSISPILTPCLVIFQSNFIFEHEYPYMNQVTRTTIPSCPCQAHIFTMYYFLKQFQVHVSRKHLSMPFKLLCSYSYSYSCVHVQDVHVVIPISSYLYVNNVSHVNYLSKHSI